MSNKIIKIDPAKLTDKTSRILHILLQQSRQSNIQVLYNNVSYTVQIFNDWTGQIDEVVVQLTNTLVYRTKPNSYPGKRRKIDRYSILDVNLLGGGQYGSVYRVLGTLHHRKNCILRKQDKRRVIKVQANDIWAQNEAKNSLIAPHLHAKYLTIDAGADTSYLVIKEFSGQTLQTIIDNDKCNINPIPLEKRIQISINIMRAVLEQVHDLDLVHRDLKPANIIVNMDTCEVNVIDYGFSRNKFRNDYMYPGSPAYAAPEVYSRSYPYDQISDIYSVGLILRGLWRAEERTGMLSDLIDSLVVKKTEPASLDDLGSGISGISTHHLEMIRIMLVGMADFNPAHRSTLDQGITLFEGIKLEQRLKSVPVEHWQCVRSANVLAAKTRVLLDNLDKNKTTSTPITELKKVLDGAVDQLGDTKYELSEFIETIGIESIRHCATKHAVKKQVDGILNQYAQDCTDIILLAEQLDNSRYILERFSKNTDRYAAINTELEYMLADIEHLLFKIHRRKFSLDNVRALSARYAVAIAELKNEMRPVVAEFLSNQYPEILQSYKKLSIILQKLDYLMVNDAALPLRRRIKEAIRHYIDANNTEANLLNLNRANSVERQNDIDEVITLLESEKDDAKLITRLDVKLSNLKTGLFGRSDFRKMIQEAVAPLRPNILSH